jgi:uncharacterized membrane protein
VLLFLLSVMALGVTLNLLFRRERQRIYLSSASWRGWPSATG